MENLVQHLINGLNVGAIYGLIALGYTMVYGILQLINFAHSDVYMVGAFAAFYGAKYLKLAESPGLVSLLICIAIASTTCAVLGLLIERLAYRPLRSSPKVNVLITAIGVSLFLQFTGQQIFGAAPESFPEIINDSVVFSWGQIQIRLVDVTLLSVTVIIMLLLRFFVQKTKTGLAMRAVSYDPKVASLMGISVNRIVLLTFVIGSGLAGVASVLVGIKYSKIDVLMGMVYGLKAFVAAVLGGIGSFSGAVLGSLLMGICEEFVGGYLSSSYRDAFAFGILIVVLVWKPTGLLGTKQAEKV